MGSDQIRLDQIRSYDIPSSHTRLSRCLTFKRWVRCYFWKINGGPAVERLAADNRLLWRQQHLLMVRRIGLEYCGLPDGLMLHLRGIDARQWACKSQAAGVGRQDTVRE